MKVSTVRVIGVNAERRPYIPLAFLPATVVATNKLYTLDGATLYHFGVLASTMHMAWTRYTAGRMKSDYQYSAGIVYNNFPWPVDPSSKQRKAIEDAAQHVLDAREPHLDAGSTLADLYDPLTMPSELVRAHQTLDKTVDRSYRPQPFTTETNRVAYLFDRYEELTNALFA